MARRTGHVWSTFLAGSTFLALLAIPVPAFGTTPDGTITYGVFGPTIKIRPTQDLTGSPRAVLMGARNEFVSFQVMVPGGSSGLADVTVKPGMPLSGPGRTIPNDNLLIYREDYYYADQSSTVWGDIGYWPDPLIPTADPLYGEPRNAFPMDVPADENRVAYVDILVPRNQAPGRYTGSIVIRADGEQTSVPVQLDVRNFTLPSTSSARSLYTLNWRTPFDALYSGDPFEDESLAWRANRDLAQLALDNRVTIANAQFQPPVNATEIAFFREYLLPLVQGTAPTRLTGARMTTIDIDTANASQVAAWRTLAESEGFASRAVSYDGRCDEPDTEAEWNACSAAVSMITGEWAALPNVVTTDITEATHAGRLDLIDVIAPVVDHLHGKPGSGVYAGDQRPKYDDFLAEPGNQLWVYTSCDASGCGGAGETDPYYYGWPDYTIDTAASQNRAMGWMVREYRTTGELYYQVDNHLVSAWTDQWDFGGNGDGTLFYPGTTDRIGGTTPVPIESWRLKSIRNGNQDREYLRLATAAGHGAKAMEIARVLFPRMYDTRTTDAAINNARRRLADLIEGVPIRPPTLAGSRITTPVKIDGKLSDLAGGGTIRLAGSNDRSTVQIRWNPTHLFAGYTVRDDVRRVNEGGDDGEVWNGDGIELMIDRSRNRSTAPDSDDYHILVNVSGDVTDERGDGSGWDRAWSAGAHTAVRLLPNGDYSVELAVPWDAIGGPPRLGARLGQDVAANDSDVPDQLVSYDWAHLTRFAQPDRWGTLRLVRPPV